MRTDRPFTVCWSLPRGGSAPGGSPCVCVCVGGWFQPGGLPAGGALPALPETPPVDRITDACKNITLAQLRCDR